MGKNKISVCVNDDYVSASIYDENYDDIVSVYYGYESTHCPDGVDEDGECDDEEWCFEIQDLKGNKVKISRSTLEKEGEDLNRGIERYTLVGIIKLLKDGVLVIDEEKLKNYPDNLDKSE